MGNSVMVSINPNQGPVTVVVDNSGECNLVLSADGKKVEFPVPLRSLGKLKMTERVGADSTTVRIDNNSDSVELEVSDSGSARSIVEGIKTAQQLLAKKILSKQSIKTLAVGFMGGILFVFLYYYFFIRVQLTPEMVAQIRAMQVQQNAVQSEIQKPVLQEESKASNSETWEPK